MFFTVVICLAVLMATLGESFIQDPAESLLDQCTKEQLLKVAEHCDIEIADKKIKESVKTCLKEGLEVSRKLAVLLLVWR